MFLGYNFFHNIGKYAFSNVSILYVLVCGPEGMVRPRSIYNRNYTYMVYQSDGSGSVIANWKVAKTLFGTRGVDICTVYHLYVFECVAVGVIVG